MTYFDDLGRLRTNSGRLVDPTEESERLRELMILGQLQEALDFIGDLLVHLARPPSVTLFHHGGLPLTEEESLAYTIDGAKKFYQRHRRAEPAKEETE